MAQKCEPNQPWNVVIRQHIDCVIARAILLLRFAKKRSLCAIHAWTGPARNPIQQALTGATA